MRRAADEQSRRGRGELESEVLAALWAAERPLTPAAVQQGLDHPIAYNTVQTILTRLHDKGLVAREKTGRADACRARSRQRPRRCPATLPHPPQRR